MANETVRLNNIVKDPRLQLRVKGLDKHHVAELVDALKSGKKLGAIKVCRKGKKVFPFDGWHRIAAHEEVGREEIDATVQDGDIEQAILNAAAANSTHGLKRTNDDKRASVMAVLNHHEAKDWSDRRIADYVGVSDMMVSSVRKSQVQESGTCRDDSQVQESGTCQETDTEKPKESKRVGKDGKTYTVKPKTSKPTTKQESSDVAVESSEPTKTNGVTHEPIDELPAEDEITKQLRSLNARLLTKEREIKALAEELSKFGMATKYPKLRTVGGLTASLDTAARSCRAVAAAVRDSVSVGTCTTCNGKGGPCKDCNGDGFQSHEERRDADNRKTANAPRVAHA